MPERSDEPPQVRAQLLATEHWSLLASRSTTQSEVLTRINMFLTLLSAGLVSLALVGQATGFREGFTLFAVIVLAFVSMVGLLTQVRVLNVAMEDLMYVLAMNRLRAAYTELDPGIAPYLMSSARDDREGSFRTYYFLGRRSDFSQMAGSSMVFILAVNSALLGLLAASITLAFRAETSLAVGAGVIVGLAHFALIATFGKRGYFRLWTEYRPVSPTPEEPA